MYTLKTSSINVETAFTVVDQYSNQLPRIKDRGYAAVLMAKLWSVIESVEGEFQTICIQLTDGEYELLLSAVGHQIHDYSTPSEEKRVCGNC